MEERKTIITCKCGYTNCFFHMDINGCRICDYCVDGSEYEPEDNNYESDLKNE